MPRCGRPSSVPPHGHVRRAGLSGHRVSRRELLDALPPRARTPLLFYGTADPPKVLSEGVGGIGGAPRQVVVESRLLAQRLTCLDFARLFAFGLPDLVRHGKHFFDTLSRHEQDPVVVAENDVVAAYQVGP